MAQSDGFDEFNLPYFIEQRDQSEALSGNVKLSHMPISHTTVTTREYIFIINHNVYCYTTDMVLYSACHVFNCGCQRRVGVLGVTSGITWREQNPDSNNICTCCTIRRF